MTLISQVHISLSSQSGNTDWICFGGLTKKRSENLNLGVVLWPLQVFIFIKQIIPSVNMRKNESAIMSSSYIGEQKLLQADMFLDFSMNTPTSSCFAHYVWIFLVSYLAMANVLLHKEHIYWTGGSCWKKSSQTRSCVQKAWGFVRGS